MPLAQKLALTVSGEQGAAALTKPVDATALTSTSADPPTMSAPYCTRSPDETPTEFAPRKSRNMFKVPATSSGPAATPAALAGSVANRPTDSGTQTLAKVLANAWAL